MFPSCFTVSLREVIYALTDALDLVGVDSLHHGKRVAYMATEVIHTLGWDIEAMDDVFAAGMLHDCGVSSTRTHRHLVSEMEWEGASLHCELGARRLAATPPLAYLATTVLYHHHRWEDLIRLPLDDHLRLASNAIFLVDRVDALLSQYPEVLEGNQFAKVRERIHHYSGSLFSPRLIEAFLSLSAAQGFWDRLQGRGYREYFPGWVGRGGEQDLDVASMRRLVNLFSDIVDAKSHFTREHSLRVAELARLIGDKSGLPDSYLDILDLAGHLHDLGKLRVPDEILDKPGPLNSAEWVLMQRHSMDSFHVLRQIRGFAEIAQLAGYHHEQPAGTGYPFHMKGVELGIGPRILSAADVFQALAQDRPYREALAPDKIMEIMQDMAAKDQLDAGIVQLIADNLHDCWLAATRQGFLAAG